ncbi:hypothetical protein Trydic_g17821 [Trypoxylus dichotomus]
MDAAGMWRRRISEEVDLTINQVDGYVPLKPRITTIEDNSIGDYVMQLLFISCKQTQDHMIFVLACTFITGSNLVLR